MNICIIGGGPTGLRIADKLGKLGYNIKLFDKEDALGGCWKVDWDEGYYREHSPRVMTTNYKRTLELFKRLGHKTAPIYGNRFEVTTMFIRYLYRYMSTIDLLKVSRSVLFISKEDKRTLKEWIDDNNITKQGERALSKLGISMATNAKEMYAYPFFSAISEGGDATFIQSVDNDQWIKSWENILTEQSNIKIYNNSKIESIKYNKNKTRFTINDIETDVVICAIPLYGLKDILHNSPKKIQNNWMDYTELTDFTAASSYSGIGIQLHFRNEMPDPSVWYANFTDWDLEVISIGTYSSELSKDVHIKEVWSCVIVDTNAKSKHLNKSANEIPDINEVIKETIRQLSFSYGISIQPFKITVAKGIKYNKTKQYWDMEHSAFNPTKHGVFPQSGDIDNLYSVGPHNFYEIAVMENAFRAADIFVNQFKKKMKMENEVVSKKSQ